MMAEYSSLEVTSKWGKSATFPYLKHTQGAEKLAVVFPGREYTLDAPLMWYAIRSAFEAGCDVLGVEYGFQANKSPMQPEDIPDVTAEVASTLERFIVDTHYSHLVFIAKSSGTQVRNLEI